LSASSLSFPSVNEFANSIVMAEAYRNVHGVAETIVNLPFTAPDLIQEFAECDHWRAIHMDILLRDNFPFVESYFGCLGYARLAHGTILFEIHQNFDMFDYEGFQQVSKHLLGLIYSQFTHIVPADDFAPTQSWSFVLFRPCRCAPEDWLREWFIACRTWLEVDSLVLGD
jgi:hypothetical protein